MSDLAIHLVTFWSNVVVLLNITVLVRLKAHIVTKCTYRRNYSNYILTNSSLKTSLFILSGFRQLHLEVIMFPLVLNNLSKGELVVHIDNTVASIFLKIEKLAVVKFPPLDWH